MEQLIKGTDILVQSDTGYKVVNNVLVGEGYVADGITTYTLGIPKGNDTDFNNKIVVVFGEKYRTTGIILGIEENIPLAWGKNVKVEKMAITGNITVYEKGTYKKHVVPDCYWTDGRGAKVLKEGGKADGTINAVLYSVCFLDNYKPKIGDIITLGYCEYFFDTLSEKTISESFAEFRSKFDFAVISEVEIRKNGDYVLSAR